MEVYVFTKNWSDLKMAYNDKLFAVGTTILLVGVIVCSVGFLVMQISIARVRHASKLIRDACNVIVTGEDYMANGPTLQLKNEKIDAHNKYCEDYGIAGEPMTRWAERPNH